MVSGEKAALNKKAAKRRPGEGGWRGQRACGLQKALSRLEGRQGENVPGCGQEQGLTWFLLWMGPEVWIPTHLQEVGLGAGRGRVIIGFTGTKETGPVATPSVSWALMLGTNK